MTMTLEEYDVAEIEPHRFRRLADANRASVDERDPKGFSPAVFARRMQMKMAKMAALANNEKREPLRKRKGGRITSNGIVVEQLDADGNVIAEFPTIVAAAHAARVFPVDIQRVMKGELSHRKGFRWRRKGMA